MNERLHPASPLSQASQKNQFNGSSQQLNITLKDLNIEAKTILRKALLRDNMKTSRDEKDVYLSGPYFPCGDYKLKKRLRKNSTASHTKNSTNDGRISKVKESSFVEIVIKEDKPNLAEPFSEVGPGEMKAFESYDSSTLQKTKIPTLSVSDFPDEKISKLSEPKEKQCMTSSKEDCLQQETRNNEFENTTLGERRKQSPSSANSRRPSSEIDLELPKEKQSVTKYLQEGTTNNQAENEKLLKDKRNKLPTSPNSRRSSSRLEARSKGTSPLFERRRESCMSHSSSENKTSPNHTQNNHISSADQFALENILNPLLRESLKKILNPQSYVKCDDTKDNTTPLVVSEDKTIFKDEILLPKIKRRLVKYHSLDYEEPSKRCSDSNDSLKDKYRKRSTKHVRFTEESHELCSTKCTRIVVTQTHPVRMLSAGSQFAVKGVIGQWLKRRSRNTIQDGREKASVEKQEAFREVQLLKIGLSMRVLAGII